MSEAKPLRCEVAWDKFNPTRLRYKLGPVEMINSGRVYNKQAMIKISKGQARIVFRNLMLYYPGYVTPEMLIDRMWPNPDTMPDTFSWCMRAVIVRLRPLLARIGLRIIVKFKVGYRLEFIPGWEAL